VIGAALIGLAAGVIAGLLGVGGGVLFVPALVILAGLDQHHAEATSLLAIVPVALLGTWRQDRYGNVHRADALLVGALSVAGTAGGVALANALSGTALRDAFAVLMVLVAWQLARRALGGGPGGPAGVEGSRARSAGGSVQGDVAAREDGLD
jgi:uncharacterized membrane protein YfcA